LTHKNDICIIFIFNHPSTTWIVYMDTSSLLPGCLTQSSLLHNVFWRRGYYLSHDTSSLLPGCLTSCFWRRGLIFHMIQSSLLPDKKLDDASHKGLYNCI